MQTELAPIMPQLKEHTQPLHDQTEQGAFNRELVHGRLPREAYVGYLAQMLLVHQALESRLRAHRDMIPSFKQVLRDYQFQEDYLRQDLAFFGFDTANVTPNPATRAFIDFIERIEAENPVALLGIHYVFEGSNNGGKFLAKAIAKAYDLDESGAGVRYYNPYGDEQRARWQAFKDDMNAVQFSGAETAAILKTASATFTSMINLFEAAYATASRHGA